VIHLRVQPHNEKHIRISGIDPVVLDSLHALPEILEQRDTPAARSRLLPDPTASDASTNNEWQRLIAPELRHLLVSAGETVTRDLTAVVPDSHQPKLFEITFPVEHLNAWMSALNQTRLILGELFKVTETDMESADFDLKKPKGLAVFRIHVLGYLLQLLIELEGGHESESSV
jgi:hypothetical protein